MDDGSTSPLTDVLTSPGTQLGFGAVSGLLQAYQQAKANAAQRKIAATMMASSPWTHLGGQAAAMIPQPNQPLTPILSGVAGGLNAVMNTQGQKQMMNLLQQYMNKDKTPAQMLQDQPSMTPGGNTVNIGST